MATGGSRRKLATPSQPPEATSPPTANRLHPRTADANPLARIAVFDGNALRSVPARCAVEPQRKETIVLLEGQAAVLKIFLDCENEMRFEV